MGRVTDASDRPTPYRRDMDTTRASDSERERTAEQLRAAIGDGRLTLTEYDERLRAAYAAVTRADLARVTADLPPPVVQNTPAPRPDRAREWIKPWREWAGGALVMVAIWAGISITAGEPGSFWPAIPLGIWAAVIFYEMITGQQRAGCSRNR